MCVNWSDEEIPKLLALRTDAEIVSQVQVCTLTFSQRTYCGISSVLHAPTQAPPLAQTIQSISNPIARSVSLDIVQSSYVKGDYRVTRSI